MDLCCINFEKYIIAPNTWIFFYKEELVLNKQPKLDVTNVRVREIAALAGLPGLIFNHHDVNVVRVMGTYAGDSPISSRFVQGALRTIRVETELDRIEEAIERLLELKIIYQPNSDVKYYHLNREMAQLIVDIARS